MSGVSVSHMLAENSMISLVVQAIREKRVLEVDYEPGTRFIEPHCVGVGSSGQYLMRCFQHGGESRTNNTEWKLLRLDRIRKLKLTQDRFFGPRPQYNPNDSVMTQGIIAAL